MLTRSECYTYQFELNKYHEDPPSRVSARLAKIGLALINEIYRLQRALDQTCAELHISNELLIRFEQDSERYQVGRVAGIVEERARCVDLVVTKNAEYLKNRGTGVDTTLHDLILALKKEKS